MHGMLTECFKCGEKILVFLLFLLPQSFCSASSIFFFIYLFCCCCCIEVPTTQKLKNREIDNLVPGVIGFQVFSYDCGNLLLESKIRRTFLSMSNSISLSGILRKCHDAVLRVIKYTFYDF